jgi:amino acid adenylation domain-containing protein
VHDAAVVAREETGDKRLVGYVVVEAGAQVDEVALIQALRDRLLEHLPVYMVPSAFVLLEHLPLTSNGKLDRNALPAPNVSTLANYAAPEGPTEELLAALWCSLLKREHVGRHDDFFEIGGHSLLATQLVSRIRETFSTELPVRQVFEHATLFAQARAVEHARGAGALVDVPMVAVSRDEPLPLSFAQQRLWFLHQYLGPNAAYTIPLALRLHGGMNEAALVRTLVELYRRHESLRTRFKAHEGSAVQVIDPPTLELEIEEVSAAEARAIARAERSYCFVLSRERLCRIRVLREKAGEGDAGGYVLLVTMHHTVSDGWSMGVLFRELVSVYRAFANGQPSPLAPLPIQYADYAQWQRRWLQGEVLESQVSYWREQLKGLPPMLTLPTDRPRPAEQTFRGGKERFALPVSVMEKLQALSREQGATTYMTLLSAWAVLLGRYASQQDVAVGTPIANRTRRETEGLIGFFVNTLVMRHDLSGDPRFVDLLKRTQATALDAYVHQDVPFEQLVEELNPHRSLSHSPLFQVMFALQNVPIEALELPDLVVRPLMVGVTGAQDEVGAREGADGTTEETARFDLTLNMRESPAGLIGILEYNTDLFERSTIRRMVAHYQRLLEAIVAAPQARLSRLEILDGEERRQQLVEWNATARSYPKDRCIHELFEEQADRSPEAIAIVVEDEERQLTYRELNERANRLAHRLIERRVGPKTRVPIRVESRVDRAVGVLGILKSGAAYVPLDPVEHLDYLLGQSNSDLVTHSSMSDEALQEYPGTNPGVATNASAMACVRYEAREAGTPTGRMISHAGVLESSGGLIESLTTWPAEFSILVASQGKAPGATHYVLDGHGELLPVGAVGELYVGGEAAGWGYRNRSSLTAEQFVPNAFSTTPGERLYRTGERARWRADGKLELVEQNRGSTLSAGEAWLQVERALLSHESVREAAVVAVEAGTQSRLVAYVVERAPGSMSAEQFVVQLKTFLRMQPMLNWLPDKWRVLEALPRTASGAVDRSKLPQPQVAELTYLAPRTELERALAEVWQEQLGLERVGVEDNYFVLGGDSIRSIALVAQASKRAIHFSIKDLFAHPTVSGLAAAIERGEVRHDGDIEEQIEPFAFLTAEERGQLSQRHDMEAVEDAYPLSMMQQGMVLESLRHADLNVYLNFQIYKFKDSWDPQVFEQALRHLLVKHPMMRTFHDFSGERPLQLVLKEPAPGLQVVDVRHLDRAAVRAEVAQWAQGELSIGVDTTVSLWRATVHVLPGDQFLFCMCLHHALWDGWSLESFVTELYAAYGQLKRQGRVPDYHPLPTYQYFVAREQSALSSETHRSYWTQKLDGATVPWWTGRKKSATAYIRCEISELTSRAVTDLAQSLGVQEKSIWCSVYLALLSLLNGTDETVGAAMTQGRPEIPGGDKIIGVFLNALPLRVSMSGCRWADLIADTDRELREQHAFRHYPLAEIQRQTGLDLSAAMFNYVNWHVYYEGVDREGTREEWIPQKVGGGQETNYLFGFTAFKDDKTQRSGLGLSMDAQVFDAAMRERIRGYVTRIVAAIVTDATAVIEKTALLSESERSQQLIEWNATARAYPQEQCVHELFEEEAARRADAIALSDDGRQLSYEELNRRSNQVAHGLREQGVGPDARVGLCMERSMEMVIAILGVLKAGGAYVPLDPGYPPQRLQYLVSDAAARVLLVDAVGREALGELAPSVRVFEVQAEGLQWANYSAQNLQATELGLTSKHAAYVIYTSGSTGAPKGVMVGHAQVINLWQALESAIYASVGGVRSVGVNASYAFDASVQQFVQLLSGRTLTIVPEAVRADPDALWVYLARHGVEALDCTPSMLEAVLSMNVISRHRYAPKVLLVGGEAFNDKLWSAAGQLQDVAFYNVYGPTECTVDSTIAMVRGGDRPHIGAPIANGQIYIVDGRLQLVPTGVASELCVGGAGLARGYLNRAGLTAEKFIPNPFSGEPGERLYRTGDLARWLPDGTLEYLGRADHQVKVRGYRIELGEIENALLAHEEVREAVVVVREDSGDKRLVGYVVAKAGAHADEAELVNALRSRLIEQLPGYMVPALMVLERLPLTVNGKLDRKALPATNLSTLTEWAAPEGPTEDLLAAMWCALLKRERVGRYDSFFELGGHSLLATQLVSRIRETFSTELPLRQVFEHATLFAQARAVERARGAGALVDVPMETVSREAPLPLSFAQQRLWFLNQYLGPNAVYNMPLAFRLHGGTNEAALVRTLVELYRRHESLRTRFEMHEGSAVQVIDPPQLELPVEAASAAEARAIARAERFYRFDLSHERLCRIRLLREMSREGVAGDYALLVTMHHGVSDGWSTGIFFRELVSVYRAYANGQPSPLAPLPIQYADYAQWQRRWLQGEVLESQVSYWREQLKDLPPLLTLPTDRPRPVEQTFRGSTERFALPASVAQQLQALSREQGATLYMTLLSAWAVLLGRYAGQQDVAVGTPVANRTRRETEGLIGFFVNTLVMRHDLSGDPRFIDLLKRTRTMALQAYAHQDVPFEQLVEELNPARSTSHTPLFQVMFILQNAPIEAIELPGLKVHALQWTEGEKDREGASEGKDREGASEGTARFDLTLSLRESAAGLLGGVEFNTDLFERKTIRRMLDHYARLLEAIATAPRSRLSQLSMLGEAEQRQQLIEWNATHRAYPQEQCVHELFEEQVKQAPDRVALVHEGNELTYAELNRRANRLAHRLIEHGVGPEMRVGICMERSPEMVIGLLGILKAGAAYVPLDPNHPQKRLAHAVQDSGLDWVVGGASDWRFLDPEHRPICVSVDAPEDGLPETRPDVNPPSCALAYVIYTSGSTGKPKGVRISHGNVVNFLLGMQEKLGIGSADRLLAVTTLSFDIALLELYLPLTVGGTVDIAPGESIADGERLMARMKESRITLLQATPVTWKLLLDSGWPGLETLTALVGGEAFSGELATRIVGKVGRIWNVYGPTETTIWSTCWRVEEGVEASTVPIGQPIANTDVYVLDDQQQLVPTGTVGQLYVAGAGVAQGYHQRPGLTAEKFIPRAFCAEPGARMYCTGDLARWLPDGTLEYLGRVDHQVKVRGYRIELGEIESVLLAHEGVRDAVVAVREDSGDKRLVGYVVAEPGAQADEVALIQALRSRLQEHLPGYMVPSALMVLERLPLTSNGKLDRKALPAPDLSTLTEYAAPEGPTEELLAALWCSLLKRETVGRHDNFFELGGHSLLATQLVSRIRQTFSTELPLRQVFEHAILSSQARAVERARGAGVLIDLPMEAVSRDEPLPLSFSQQRLWFLHQYMGPNAVYNMPLALRLRGEVNEVALVQSLQALYRRHESLRTRFAMHEGSTVQVIDPPELELQVEAVSADETQTIARSERSYRFDLSRERLCRIRLLRETGNESSDHALLVTMHHSVSDGWSLGIFFRELVSMYRAYANGGDSPLAPLPIQYADYAQWQRRWLQGEVLESQVSYWREQLGDLPPLLTLPTDRPRPVEQTFSGSMERFALPASVAQQLQTLSREQGVTLYMTLLSAWAVLLGRYAGQDDVAVGAPVANRTRRETEGLIGFFVNTLVTRHDLSGDPRFIDLLKRTRTMTLGAYAHQDVPFEQLVEELNPVRSTSHSPLFQVAFGLVNTPVEGIELPGFKVLPLLAGKTRDKDGADARQDLPEGTARFDMTLNLQESPAGLAGGLEYSTDLFDRSTIRRMLGHYARLLEAIVGAPESRLSQLSMLGEAERRQQLIEWNADSRSFAQEKCIHELFEEQADRSPEAIAVVDAERHLTYRELNERANQFAHRMMERGADPRARVAICVERGVERAVGVLGILKAGAAYVPLDAEPVERFEYLLEDSGVEMIVAQSSVRSRLESCGRRCVELETEEDLQGYPNTNPGVATNVLAMACVRYEAREAGAPIGRMISHAGVVESSGGLIDSLLTWPAESSFLAARLVGARGVAHYVLDPHGELLPVGAVGELHLGGEAGWGYCNRSSLTAEQFVPNAFSTVPGERLYRTGERARWRADGTLELVDQEQDSSLSAGEAALQVERALLSHESVREATVVAAGSGTQLRLVAYVVERAPSSMSAEQLVAQLKTFLRTQPMLNRLPEAWQVLDALPRTAAGAVDRSGLPKPDLAELAYLAPRTELERALVEVWQEQLGIGRVGVEDNYFALGGDSIRSIALVAKARERAVRFSIKDLFAHPTVSALASAIERGEVGKDGDIEREIEPFALLTEHERGQLSQRHDMEAVEDAYPLSMMQQGMVLESLRHADLKLYLNFQVYKFKEPWDPQLFEQALRHLLAKHPLMRTFHDFSGDRPLQLVLKEPAPDLQVVDVQNLDGAAIKAVVSQWTRSELSIGVDTTVSLWRATVHVMPGGQFLFCMSLHHALWDGWSLESFVTELYATYGLLKREGRIAQSPRLPSYNRFVALEQSALKSEAHRAYWTQKLDGATVPWWTGRKKAATAYLRCEISGQASHALTGLAHSLGVQEKSVWCSVYLALISLVSGTEEGLGIVMTQGRPEIPDGEKMVGVFLNALPVRVRLSGRRWMEVIAATDRELREQHEFRHYPLAEIHVQTGLDLAASGFNYTNWHVRYEGVDRAGTPDEWIPQKVGGKQDTNYLLSVFVDKDDRTGNFAMSIGADAQVFDAGFRERIHAYAMRIVDAIVSDAAAFIEKTWLLGEEERQRQLIEWNATARAYPQGQCIHELFEEQVERRPDAIATVYEGQSLSYAELNRRANRMAHFLRHQGLRPEARIGICMGRSLEMVIALLGVLKAGGCYVPLDPSYPQQRLRYLVSDAAAAVLLVDAVGKEALGELALSMPVLDVPEEARRWLKHSPENASCAGVGLTSRHPAYMIYTSGSTGAPKGVLVEHRGLCNLARALIAEFDVGESSRVLQFVSLSFDASASEFVMALCSGATLYLPSGAQALAVEWLPKVLEQAGITHLSFPPALLNELAEPEKFRALRTLIVGGEACSQKLVEAWAPGRQFINAYGPTEATVCATMHRCDPQERRAPPIGRPIANTQTYVLDEHLQLVPGGVAGELYIGGVGLARGYLNRAGLTAEKFIPNPFGVEPGERLYRTGDLVRWLPEGTLEYLGRIDHQVKVRGYRIELGEIESVLLAHEGVHDAAVVAREETGDKRLVGYVVVEAGAQVDEEALLQALRGRLLEQLPGYMVPSALMVLEHLPLTSNGKLDRNALPAPAAAAFSNRQFEAPQGEFEVALAHIWQQLLRTEQVSRQDNFFALGGHSLHAVRMSARVQKELGVDLPIPVIFSEPTLAAVAQYLESARSASCPADAGQGDFEEGVI